MSAARAIAPVLSSALTSLLNAVLPPRCLRCGADVAEAGTLCSGCWDGLTFLSDPQCHRCGVPFETVPAEGALCGACAARPPAFDRARAVFAYDDASRDLILGFKHGDRTDAAPGLGRWLSRAGGPLIKTADVIAPVPLHSWRLVQRRYNQSALLVRTVARHSGVPAAYDLLRRDRATPSQGGLGRGARRRNVANAFSVTPRYRGDLAGRRVLLVDDVLTTGATVESCARGLTRAGAAAVDVLTVARVVTPRTL